MFVGARGSQAEGAGLSRVLAVALLLALMVLWAPSGRAFAQTDGAREPDPRLDQKITLQLGKVKLADACSKISELTGVAVKAGESDREWRVRERLVTIEARDTQAGVLLEEISRLLGFRLSRGGKDGQFTYLYWQDRNAKNLEADVLNSQNAEAAERAAEMRQSTLSAARKALSMTEAQAQAEREKNPWLAYLGGTQAGRAYSGLLAAIEKSAPVERDLILRGKRAVIDLSSLPPEATQYSRQMTEGGFVAAEVRKQGQQAVFKDITPVRVTVLGSDMMGDQSAGLIGFGGMVIVMGEKPGAGGQQPQPDAGMSPFGAGMPMAIMPLARPDSMMGKALGRMLLAIDAGGSLEDANKQLMTEFSNPEVISEALARPSQTAVTPPTDPRWTREVEVDEIPATASLEQAFSGQGEADNTAFGAISKALGLPVLVESFRAMMPVSMFLKAGKQPAYAILVALERAGCIWEMDGQALRIRPADWALQRSYEIPDSFIKHYRQLLEKQQEFTLEQMAAITAALTDRQIQNNLIADPELSPALAAGLASPFGGRDILRLHGSLSSQQKAALTSEAGLPFDSLDGKQWEQMSAILADRLGGVEIADGAIHLDRNDPFKENQDKMPGMSQVNTANYKITVHVPGEENPRDVSLSVMWGTKEQVKAIRDAQKAAKATMEKAAKDREEKKKTPAAPK